MRKRAAQTFADQHAGELHVRRIQRGAGHLGRAFGAAKRLADLRIGRHRHPQFGQAGLALPEKPVSTPLEILLVRGALAPFFVSINFILYV